MPYSATHPSETQLVGPIFLRVGLLHHVAGRVRRPRCVHPHGRGTCRRLVRTPLVPIRAFASAAGTLLNFWRRLKGASLSRLSLGIVLGNRFRRFLRRYLRLARADIRPSHMALLPGRIPETSANFTARLSPRITLGKGACGSQPYHDSNRRHY